MDEQKALLEAIGRVAGKINRHKNGQTATTAPPSGSASPSWPSPPSRGTWHSRASHHHQHHNRTAHRTIRKPAHRHKSLVLNAPRRACETESGESSDSVQTQWITRNDRHRQLISMAVYEKETQARAQAMEASAKNRQNGNDRQELTRVHSFVRRFGAVAPAASDSSSRAKYEIEIEGIRFRVAAGGSKLVRLPDTGHSARDVPKMAVVGGVRFFRTKSGNLVRQGIVNAQQRQARLAKTKEPCRHFSMTGNMEHLSPQDSRSISLPLLLQLSRSSLRVSYYIIPSTAGACVGFLTRRSLGSCTKGPMCRYRHDPSRVAACREFLQKGTCKNGDSCDLSHDLGPQRTPTCLHFLKDSCSNPSCRYAHVSVEASANVCHAFGTYGYCDKGAACVERHVYECPDFSNTGVCKTRGCKLPHRERASMLRRTGIHDGSDNEDHGRGSLEGVLDLSSDDEDGASVGSADVDSDEVDEFIEGDEEAGLDFANQSDFIGL